MHGNAHLKYDIDKKAILMAHQMGVGLVGLSRGLATLGFENLQQHPYEKCEELVGNIIKQVANNSMSTALQKEIELSAKAGQGNYATEQYGSLPALIFSTDAGWQKRSSSRRYDSASGVVHMVGVHTQKICASRLTINKCSICEKKEKYKERKTSKSSKQERTQKKNTKQKSKASLLTIVSGTLMGLPKP